MEERERRTERSFPLRRMRCAHHYMKTEDKDESGGSVYRGFYEVELMIRNDGDDDFTSVGKTAFSTHAQAIAMCMARLVGEFDRKVPEGIETPFAASEDTEFWMFDIHETVRERKEDGSIRKGSRSSIRARRSIFEEPAKYKGIGHFGVLGLAHVIDTISRDDHLGHGRRMDTAMFRYAGKMYMATLFHAELPTVYGRCITPGFEYEEIHHLNYHVHTVMFYNFDTVVRCGGHYYLDGNMVHDGVGSSPWSHNDEVLRWVADNYPGAKRFSFDMETGSLEWIRRGNDND